MSTGPVGDLESTEAESRRAARERALQLLYEAEAKGIAVEAVLGGLPVAPDALAVELSRGVETHRERIDEVLARLVAPKWSLARLAAVDRAILRVGAYELYEVPSRSQALVINEAVLLARRFGTDDSPRFVNGVLSSLAAEARPPGTVPGRDEASDAPDAPDSVGDE
jgi:N utilization substance protein B